MAKKRPSLHYVFLMTLQLTLILIGIMYFLYFVGNIASKDTPLGSGIDHASANVGKYASSLKTVFNNPKDAKSTLDPNEVLEEEYREVSIVRAHYADVATFIFNNDTSFIVSTGNETPPGEYTITVKVCQENGVSVIC